MSMINHQRHIELFQNIFESSSQAMLVVDKRSIIIQANLAACSLFALTKTELINTKLISVLQQLPELIANNEKEHSSDVWITKQNGSQLLVTIKAQIISNNDGDQTIIYITDATNNLIYKWALKENKQDLLESQRRHQTLINNLNGIVYSCDNNIQYMMNYINDGCYAITGYTSTDFLKGIVHYGNIILEEDQLYAWNEVQKALSQKKHFDISYRIEKKDGTIKYVREIGCGVFRNGDSKISLEGFITDITDLETVKQKLKNSQVQLETYSKELERKVKERTNELTITIQKLVESNLSLEDQILETQMAEKSAVASKSMSTAIAKNFPNGFIIIFNSNFEILFKGGEAITDLGLDNIISEGMSVDNISIFSGGQKEQLKQDILRTLSGGHLNFEISYKKRPFSVSTTPLMDENNKVSSAFFVYNDISTQKKIERKTQNALKKEQELNELKSRFISMASHEFRTPLSAIQTSAILIGKQNESGKEEKRKKYVRQIKSNVKNLVTILNDFLSLSKLEEGKVTANKELFDLTGFSKKIIEEISITKKANQNITFSAPERDISLSIDPKLTRHVLMNLLSNAIKYSPENTSINIKIKDIDKYVSLEVQDQGIGIPKEEQHKLFERFFRAKNAHNIEGTGLGLNIVKQYVELMDGTIDFKSQPNKGTSFYIKWPKPNK